MSVGKRLCLVAELAGSFTNQIECLRSSNLEAPMGDGCWDGDANCFVVLMFLRLLNAK